MDGTTFLKLLLFVESKNYFIEKLPSPVDAEYPYLHRIWQDTEQVQHMAELGL